MAVERRCKASSSEFKTIWPGLKRCMVCGFALATEDTEDGVKYPKEDSLHSTYHGKFYKAKSEYGSSNVLDYKTLKKKEEELESNLAKIKSFDFTSDIAEISIALNNVSVNISRVDDWLNSISSCKSPMVNDAFMTIRKSIENIRNVIARKDMEKVLSATIYQEILYDILPDYRIVFDEIQNLIMLKTSKAIKGSEELDAITLPDFSFNVSDKVTYIENILQIIPTKQSKLDMVLNEVYTVEFTRSLRLWDMCKAHPRFEDYVTLLWNTPKFRNFMRPYMTDIQFNTLIEKHKSNRQLFDYKFKEAPFYFGRVILSDECTSIKGNKDKKVKCDGICKKCKYAFKDLSYTDRLVDISDEEESSDGYENTPEYQKTAKTMEALGKIFNK